MKSRVAPSACLCCCLLVRPFSVVLLLELLVPDSYRRERFLSPVTLARSIHTFELPAYTVTARFLCAPITRC